MNASTQAVHNRLAAVLALAAARLEPDRQQAIQRIAPEYFQRLDPRDLAERTPEDLLGADTEDVTLRVPPEDLQLRAVLEAIVYVADEPLPLAQLAASLQQPSEKIEELMRQLKHIPGVAPVTTGPTPPGPTP